MQQLLAPLGTVVALLWSALLALAAEASSEGPRGVGSEVDGEALPVARRLHVAHLIALFLAAIAGSGAVAWWTAASWSQGVRVVLVIGLIWVVGDLLPRVVAVLEPGFTHPAHRAAVRTLWLLRPVFRVVAWADRHGHPRPRDARRGTVESNVVRGMITLPDSTVGDIMTPRIDIVAVDAADSRDHVVETLRRSEHARILVYDGNPDAVTGVLYAKDMLPALAAAAEAPWTTLIRPVPFVPEGKSLDRQLRDFQRGPQHLAVVVDEYGGTAGLVTLEDILEEIVGEIHDEYDTDEVDEIQQVRADTWIVQGEAPLADLEAELHHEFDREDVSTVGGLVLAEFGRVPRPRESIRVNGFRVTVDLMIRRRVKRVVVERLPPDAEAAAEGDGE